MEPKPNIQSERNFNVFVIVVVAIFLIGWILGVRGPVLIANNRCYELLGCNRGFFGYDAALHFLSGIMDVSLAVWLTRRYPSLNIFHARFWKNFLVAITLVAFISVAWEFGEFCHDQFREKVFHENLIALDHLDQPSNDDTVGDMTFAVLGAAATAFALRKKMTATPVV